MVRNVMCCLIPNLCQLTWKPSQSWIKKTTKVFLFHLSPPIYVPSLRIEFVMPSSCWWQAFLYISDCFSKTSDRWAGLGGHNSLCPHQRDGANKYHGLAWTIPIFPNSGFLARLTRRYLQGANPHFSTISALAMVYFFKCFWWIFVAAPTRVLRLSIAAKLCAQCRNWLSSMIAMPSFLGCFLFCPLPVAMSISLLFLVAGHFLKASNCESLGCSLEYFSWWYREVPILSELHQ